MNPVKTNIPLPGSPKHPNFPAIMTKHSSSPLFAAFAGLLIAMVGSSCPAAAPTPDCYVRKSNWHASLLASLDALAGHGLEDGFEPFESETLRGGDPACPIRVPLQGAKELFLLVTGVPDVRWAVADWADARIIRDDGSAAWVAQTTGTTALLGRMEKDITLKSGLYQKLRLHGRTFDHGLNVQADSIIRVPLKEAAAWFEASIGVDDWAGANGTVRFSVLGARSAAARRLWEPLLRDFSTGQDRQQMNWEREDRIFEFAWQPRHSRPTSRINTAWNASGKPATCAAVRWGNPSSVPGPWILSRPARHWMI